jgi:hypothetical protein
MSDPAPTSPDPQPVPHASPVIASADAPRDGGSPLLRLAGIIALTSVLGGFLILLAGCAGAQLFALSPIIVAGGALGLLLALLAATIQRHRITEETHLLLALFAGVISILGGLLEMAVWKGWALFPK